MNVRERAKTFEALMSTGSPETERKRGQDDSGTEHSGCVSSNGQNESGQEKHKPIPPPRKTRKKVPTRPDSPKVQQKITPVKSSHEVQLKQPPEKPKIAPKKPPPPRPAPYKQLSSPSLMSHIPQAKRQELSTSLSRRRKASEANESPGPTSGGSPKASPRSHSKEHPVKPPRGSPKASPRVSRGSPKVTSSCEIELSHEPPKRTSDDTPEKGLKGTPQRPPPPKRTSSLSRKSKPPVPPKPKRPHKPAGEPEKKAATIPRTGSVESKEAVPKKSSLEDRAIEDLITKQRSLSSPLLKCETSEHEGKEAEKQSNIAENGVEDSHKIERDFSNEEHIALKQDDKIEISDINEIERSQSLSDSDTAQQVSTMPEKVPAEDELNSREIQNNINEKENIATIPTKDETSLKTDLNIENVERTSVDNAEFKSVSSNSEVPLLVDDSSKLESSDELETKESKEIIDVQNSNNVVQDDLELNNSSVISAVSTEDVEENADVDTEMKETKIEGSNEGTNNTLSVCEPMETDIDAEIINSSQSDNDEHFESSEKELYPCEEDSLQKDETPSVGTTTTATDTCNDLDNFDTSRQDLKEEVYSEVECVQDDAPETLFEKEDAANETLTEDVSMVNREPSVTNEISTTNSNDVEQDVEETDIDAVECHPNENGLLTTLQTNDKEEEKEECISDVDKSLFNELHNRHEPTEEKTEESSTNDEENYVNDVIASNDASDTSPGPESSPSDEKRLSYMETSLDDEFFNGDEVNESEMMESGLNETHNEQPVEEFSEEPYETHIDLDVVMIPKDEGIDTSVNVPEDHATDEITVTEEDESKGLSKDSIEEQESESVEASPVRISQYENVMITSPGNDQVKNDDTPHSPQPVKPSRPSRLKNKHTYENTALVQSEVSIEESSECHKEAEQDKKSSQRTDVYENTSIIQAQETTAGADETSIERTSKRTDVYENAVVIRQSMSSEEREKEDSETVESAPKDECREENKQTPIQNLAYENVVFKGEETFEEDDNVYQVPRRNSFHSESPTSSMVRSARSASVGSMERKKGGRNAMRSSKTDIENTYATPPTRTSTSPEPEETYASPKSVRAFSTEETCVALKSVLAASDADNVYVAPRSIRSPSTEQEDLYVTPKSITTTDTEDLYDTPKSIRGTSEPAPVAESEYHVPSSLSNEEVPNDVYQVPRKETGTENEVYSVPASIEPSIDDPPLDDDRRLRRATRSSVLTSREQLPSSLKNAPPKPPRLSFDDSDQQSEISKPKESISTLGDSEQTPEAAPRPKPRSKLDHSSEERVEKDENHEQSDASPKPKRPGPPRPKAPSFVGTVDKSTLKNDSETKQKAPPRPPPPPLNRVSVVSSEQDSLPASPMDSSSESEDEQPPTQTGPPKKKTYHIAHEILSTEKTFVTALTLCYEDCYGMIKEADVVPESTLNDIFKDLGNIYHLDVKFLNELQERMKTWEENERIGDIVKKYSYFLKMYTTYINHYDRAINVLQETTKENLQFAELVQQFQASEKCKGLFLESFMLKPVQRIPSYRLLLIDYLKHLPPDSDEYKDIKVALDIVSEVATHINESMKRSDNFQRVLSIQESLVGNAEIVKPGREFIKEGTLQKLCRKDMQERTFFLLTDVLLYTSAVGGGQYKLKGTFPLLGIKVALPDSPEFENEFSIISKSRSFTLSASTQAERDEWIEDIGKAVSALTKKKSTFLLSKDGTVSPPEGEEDDSKLGEKAPVWIQDTRVTMCMLCTDKFTVTNRRHHCRGCGKVVCGSCSDNLAPLAYLDYAQARVCEVCYEVLLKDQNKSIKEATTEVDQPPPSPVGIGGDDLDRINRKPPKFEILHRFKPGSRRHNRRSKIFTARPSVRTEVVGHDSESQMSGYLRFKRTNKHGWKRVWFVLKDNVLYTYKASEDVVAMETIPILGYAVQEATRTEADEIQFQLKHAGLPPISFKTETESSAFRWIQELRKATTL